MNAIANTFRGFLNITASGVLLLIAVVSFNSMTNAAHSNSNFESDDIAGMAAFFALACLSGYLAKKFSMHRPRHSSSTACSILNAIACLLFAGSPVYFVTHR